MIDQLNNTIVAISTPRGPGAIGIIRISGDNSFLIANKISKKKVNPGHIQYSSFFDKNDNLLDIGIILGFKKPKSFTGEDLIELHTHGSDLILNSLISRIIKLGARFAEPGEFTFRAFLNNKLDLIQAESINLLIKSKNATYNKFILKSLLGNLSKEIKHILKFFLEIRDQIEASVEFPDDISFNLNDILFKIEKVKNIFNLLFNKLRSSYFISNKYKIIILGDTNVGKSSLFNLLLKKKRSIISSIPGTTRDFIENDFEINGFEFKLVDTAGFNQNTTSCIEKHSISRTLEQIDDASLIIFMFDILKNKDHFKCKTFNNIFNKYKNDKKFFVLKNKIDLINHKEKIIFNKNYIEIYISVKKLLGINLFFDEIKRNLLDVKELSYIISKRHYNLFLKIKKILKTIDTNKNTNLIMDIYAEKIKHICELLEEILGKKNSKDVISSVFSNFCVGK